MKTKKDRGLAPGLFRSMDCAVHARHRKKFLERSSQKSCKEDSLLVTYADMFQKLMRAIGGGYRSFVAGLEDAWKAMQDGEEPGQAVEVAIPVSHDCADDLNGMNSYPQDDKY